MNNSDSDIDLEHNYQKNSVEISEIIIEQNLKYN